MFNISGILKNLSSLAKDDKMKSLEDLVVKVGYDPKYCKVVEEIIKNKNADISTLRKQLKLPSTEDPQNKEIAENEYNKEEILNLIIDQNLQIRNMEEQIE